MKEMQRERENFKETGKNGENEMERERDSKMIL